LTVKPRRFESSGIAGFLGVLQALAERNSRRCRQSFRVSQAGRAASITTPEESRPLLARPVGSRYRALAVESDDTLIWFWIGTHAEYDGLVG
jgi:hypothetical protein